MLDSFLFPCVALLRSVLLAFPAARKSPCVISSRDVSCSRLCPAEDCIEAGLLWILVPVFTDATLRDIMLAA